MGGRVKFNAIIYNTCYNDLIGVIMVYNHFV